MTHSLALRVAFRYAKEFSKEKDLLQYLKDHPAADKANHTVVEGKPGKPGKIEEPSTEKKKPKLKQTGPKKEKVVLPPTGPSGGQEKRVLPQPETGEGKGKFSFNKLFKGLSDKAVKFAESTSEGTQKFLKDKEFRKQVLTDSADSIAKSSKKYWGNLKKVLKHEKEHIQKASNGIKRVIGGGKMLPDEKKAFRKIATHMAITAVASAFVAQGSALVMAGAFGKGVSRQIAVKAVLEAFEGIHMADEIGHIGHGAGHAILNVLHKIAAEEKDSSEMDKLMVLVLASVMKHIDQLDDDSIKQALEDAADGKGTDDLEVPDTDKDASALRVAARFQRN